jgi:site-specific recombinase XerD
MTKLAITNQAYNKELGNAFKALQVKYPELNFKTNYGSHCGRDTFISKCVQKGVDWKTILTWVGQSSFTIMNRYIKVTNQYEQDQMNKAFKSDIAKEQENQSTDSNR